MTEDEYLAERKNILRKPISAAKAAHKLMELRLRYEKEKDGK